LANTAAIPGENPFQGYLNFQQRWRALRKLTFRELHEDLHTVIEKSRINHQKDALILEPPPARAAKADQLKTPPPIEGVPFFAGLNDEQVEKLFAIGDQVHFDKDEVILKEGSLNSNLYIILRGAARIVLANNSEESMELIEVGDGEVLGEVSLLIDAPHAATVTALEPTEVIEIKRARLMKLTEEAPELAAQVWHQLAVSLGTRLRNTDTRYLSHVRETHDVADKMLGTGPLEEPEPDSGS
jgi:CRP-like cAMP-binding protein